MDSMADLHVHSTASDGKYTPTNIVALAASLGLSTIALTDHDTVDGLREAQAAGSLCGVQIVPGIELSTEHKGTEVHVLGYFIQPQRGALSAKLRQLRAARHRRAVEILRRLQSLGLPLSWDQIRNHLAGDVVGRPHIARALVNVGYVQSVQEAFDRYLKQGRPAYVPRYKLTPLQAIKLVHQSKGAAVLAHPGTLSDPSSLETLLELDWQGIEVFHPDHSDQVTAVLQHIAPKRNLVCTGGSDFHGNNLVGRNLGACTVNNAAVEALRRRCRF
ncbi:MAG TPA: PHP domain-containing protein [Firmicutes bacterium]|nr:PHP domain-containing protein [Bacillota bacterium]